MALETIYTTDHRMIGCVNGRLLTIVVDRQCFFVGGFQVNVSRLGWSLGCDPTDVPSLGIAPLRCMGRARLRMTCLTWRDKKRKTYNQSTCSVPSSVLLAGKSLLNTWTTSSSSLAQFATNNELGEEEDMWECIKTVKFSDSETTSSALSSNGAPDPTTRYDVDLRMTIAALHEWSVCHEQFKSKSGPRPNSIMSGM